MGKEHTFKFHTRELAIRYLKMLKKDLTDKNLTDIMIDNREIKMEVLLDTNV